MGYSWYRATLKLWDGKKEKAKYVIQAPPKESKKKAATLAKPDVCSITHRAL
jgi:hypothetical protein